MSSWREFKIKHRYRRDGDEYEPEVDRGSLIGELTDDLQATLEEASSRAERFGDDILYHVLPDHFSEIIPSRKYGDGDPLNLYRGWSDAQLSRADQEQIERELAGIPSVRIGRKKAVSKSGTCEGSREPAVFQSAASASHLTKIAPVLDREFPGDRAECSWCHQMIMINADGTLRSHYPPIEQVLSRALKREREEQPTVVIATPERQTTAVPTTAASPPETIIAPGQVWESIRSTHFDMRVEVERVNPAYVSVRVLDGGSRQNKRKVRGKPWHIKRDVLLAHYRKATEALPALAEAVAVAPQQPVVAVKPEPVVPVLSGLDNGTGNGHAVTQKAEPVEIVAEPKLAPEAAPVQPVQPVKPSKLDLEVQRVVNLIKRRGGPIKSYIITQYGPSGLNSRSVAELVEYGVKLGLLDTWYVTTPGKPWSRAQMVGLAGQPRTGNVVEPPKAPQSKPEVKVEVVPEPTPKPVLVKLTKQPVAPQPRVTRETKAETTRRQIEQQYNALTDADRADIANLAASNIPFHEIQRTYGVLSAVVGRIKREHGVVTKRPSRSRRNQQPVEQTQLSVVDEEQPEPTLKPEEDTQPEADTSMNGKTEYEGQEQGDQDWQDIRRRLVDAMPVPAPKKKSGPTFSVVMVVMQPTVVTVDIAAETIDTALAIARERRDVVEIISVSKSNNSHSRTTHAL